MKPVNDAPQKSKSPLTAPAINTRKEDRRAERVMLVYKEKYEHLCLLAIKYLNSSEVFAEDIVADVFIDALNNWSVERFEGIKNLESYISQSVINRSNNFRKRNRRLIHVNDFPLDSLLITNPMMKLDFDLDGLTKMLPTKQRDAFSLYCKGYSHEEIAEMLDCSEGASKTAVYNAKKKLQQIWNELPDEDPDEPRPSSARSKVHQKASRHNNRLLSIPTGNQPKVKDLLDYLRGNEQHAKVRNAILLWIITDKYAADIISGLKFTMNNNSEINIETRLKKGKDNLRRRLLGAMQSKDFLDNRFLFNTAQTSLRPFNIEKGKQTFVPITAQPASNPAILPDITQPCFFIQNCDPIAGQNNNLTKYNLDKLIAYYLLSTGMVITMSGVMKE